MFVRDAFHYGSDCLAAIKLVDTAIMNVCILGRMHNYTCMAYTYESTFVGDLDYSLPPLDLDSPKLGFENSAELLE